MYCDAHTHLDLSRFRPDLEQVIERARAHGVTRFLNMSSSPGSIRDVLALASTVKGLYAGVGVHPHWASEVDEQVFSGVIKSLSSPGVVAVGEIGLDFYRNLSPRETQTRVFKRFLDLALEHGLPVVIHSRNSLSDVLDILEQYRQKTWRGIIHCFSGDHEALLRALKLGFHISFAGNITYRKDRRIISGVPEERLLIETDCPYLSPHPHRGKRNEPARIPLIAGTVADERRLYPEDVGRITTLNLLQLIDPGEAGFEPAVAYKIRDSLYLNITNRCTSACRFCISRRTDRIAGYNLRLKREPGVEEILGAVEAYGDYGEIVFCGFGEPTLRLDTLIPVATALKKKGKRIRVDTNGHGSLFHGEDITRRLKGIVDAFSVSLNAADPVSYRKICAPDLDGDAFAAVVDFIRSAASGGFSVGVTAVDAPGVDIKKCRSLAEGLGAAFRIRNLGFEQE